MQTLAQMMSRTWSTKEKAETELYRNKIPTTGSNYALGLSKPGIWMLLDVAPATKAKPAGQAAKAAHPADLAMLAKIAQAKSFNVHFRISPSKRVDRPAATLVEARKIAEELNAAHGKSGRRAGIYAMLAKGAPVPVPADYVAPAAPAPLPEPPKLSVKDETLLLKLANAAGKETAAPAAPAAAEAEPSNDMATLPASDGPYTFEIGEPMPQFAVASLALEFSRKVGALIAIKNKAGKVVRVIDGRIGAGGRNGTSRRKTSNGGAASSTVQVEATELQKKCLALALRKEGVKRTEMTALNNGVVINWKAYLVRAGQRAGYSTIRVDKTGETPIYWLTT